MQISCHASAAQRSSQAHRFAVRDAVSNHCAALPGEDFTQPPHEVEARDVDGGKDRAPVKLQTQRLMPLVQNFTLHVNGCSEQDQLPRGSPDGLETVGSSYS